LFGQLLAVTRSARVSNRRDSKPRAMRTNTQRGFSRREENLARCASVRRQVGQCG
jgi:hypothetical protein